MWFFNDFTNHKSIKRKSELPRTRDDIVVEFDEEDSTNASKVSLPGLPRGAKRIPCETCKGHLGCKVILDPPTASTANGLQRLSFFLTCFGLLYTRKKTQKVSYSMFYSIFICFLCGANFLRFFAAYSANEAYGSKLFLKIILHVWYGQVASVTLIYFFNDSNHLNNLLTKWNEYVFRYQCETAQHLKLIGDRNVHRFLTKKAKGIAIVSDKELEKFRFQHQKLCRLTKQTDGVFALYNLIVFATSIPLLCLFIYTFAFHAFDGKELAIALCAMHILLIAAQLGMVTGAASALNRQATAPKEELFEMEMDTANENAQARAIQVTLFMHRLANDHIGLTAWNLLNINKRTILTVTTMILSYVFVLIKFGLTLEYDGQAKISHLDDTTPKNVSSINCTSTSIHA